MDVSEINKSIYYIGSIITDHIMLPAIKGVFSFNIGKKTVSRPGLDTDQSVIAWCSVSDISQSVIVLHLKNCSMYCVGWTPEFVLTLSVWLSCPWWYSVPRCILFLIVLIFVCFFSCMHVAHNYSWFMIYANKTHLLVQLLYFVVIMCLSAWASKSVNEWVG